MSGENMKVETFEFLEEVEAKKVDIDTEGNTKDEILKQIEKATELLYKEEHSRFFIFDGEKVYKANPLFAVFSKEDMKPVGKNLVHFKKEGKEILGDFDKEEEFEIEFKPVHFVLPDDMLDKVTEIINKGEYGYEDFDEFMRSAVREYIFKHGEEVSEKNE